MSNTANPFKVGDKVVRLPQWHIASWRGYGHVVATVTAARDAAVWSSLQLDFRPPGCPTHFNGWWAATRFRAAIAGQDYPLPNADYENFDAVIGPNSGHLPDGSSVQKHSAGGLYPVVLVYRNKRGGPNADGKYDVGVISPKNPEPMWFKSSDAAINVAKAIKENL